MLVQAALRPNKKGRDPIGPRPVNQAPDSRRKARVHQPEEGINE